MADRDIRAMALGLEYGNLKQSLAQDTMLPQAWKRNIRASHLMQVIITSCSFFLFLKKK
jgi:hypothetical protein